MADDLLAGCKGGTSILHFQIAAIHGLTFCQLHPNAVTTADGPLGDFITVAGSRS